MALALRRVGRRGYTRVDEILSGPQAGTMVIFQSNETDRVCVMANPPSGTCIGYDLGTPEYSWWDNNVNFTGDWELGAELDVARTKLTGVALWLEFWLWPQMLAVEQAMVNEGWTQAQQRQGFAASMVGWGVPVAQAQVVAVAWIPGQTKPAYGDLGIAELPSWVLDLAGVFAYPGLDIKT